MTYLPSRNDDVTDSNELDVPLSLNVWDLCEQPLDLMAADGLD